MSFIERFLAGRDFVICRPDEHWHHPEDVPIPNELKDSYKIVDRCIIQRLTDRHVLVGLFSHDPSDVMDCHTSHWGYTTLRLYTTDDFCLSSATESVKLYDVENSGLSIPPRISRDFDPEVLAKALTVDKIASLLSTRWGDDQHGESRRGEELCCVKLTIPDEIWQEHIIWDKKRKGLTLTAEEQAMEREIIKKKNEENALKAHLQSVLGVSDIAEYRKKPLVRDYSVLQVLVHPTENLVKHNPRTLVYDIEGSYYIGGGPDKTSPVVPYLVLMKGDKVVTYAQGDIQYCGEGGRLPTKPIDWEKRDISIEEGKLKPVYEGRPWAPIIDFPSLQLPQEVLDRMTVENNLKSSNPDRKALREIISRIGDKERAIRSDVRKGVKSLSAKQEQSPRHQRAQKLKEIHEELGYKSAIEGAKTLKSRERGDELGRDQRKLTRQRLSAQRQQADELKQERQTIATKLAQPVPERQEKAKKVIKIRSDVLSLQKEAEKAQAEFKKAQQDYLKLRKPYKVEHPKPPVPPQPKPPVPPQPKPPVPPQPKPQPSLWKRLFKRNER